MAQATKPEKAKAPAGSKLKMVIILSRHGVRSPTWTQDRLDAYSSQPWPDWSVPPGDLTAHGHELLKLFGAFDRATLADAGLFESNGCKDADASYIWADTDERTLESGHALAEGLFPGCAPMVHSRTPGTNDPLFHPAAGGVKQNELGADIAAAEVRRKGQSESQPAAQQNELIAEVQRVLLGCSPATACTPAHSPEMTLVATPAGSVRQNGGHGAGLHGALALSSTFSEDFLLEYAEGMPMTSVGWGKLDERELRRLLALHTAYFGLAYRTPALARIEASNMLFHIERTLQQGLGAQSVPDAIGPAGAKLILLVGHDTNIAALAELLGLHWTLDQRSDDTPPGVELSFELWQDAGGAYSVRIVVSAQTLSQMREMRPITPATPPARQAIAPQGCAAVAYGCAWADFQHLADTAVDLKDVSPESSN